MSPLEIGFCLHNSSPITSVRPESDSKSSDSTINANIAIIFTDDAVLTVKQENFEVESLTQKAFSHINLCVRKADLLIRNISNKDLFRRVVILDDFQYNNVISQDLALKWLCLC